jgi:Prolyl oligopeptidase family
MIPDAQSIQSCSACTCTKDELYASLSDIVRGGRRYGGPKSQTVNMVFDRDWHEYVACDLQYIVVIVDGRGTGYKGRKLRNPVKNNLGFWETRDQINAARLVPSAISADSDKNNAQDVGYQTVCGPEAHWYLGMGK